MKKGRIRLCLVLLLLVGVAMTSFPAVAAANMWSDITDAQWQSIYGVTATQVKTVAEGYLGGRFGPYDDVTRGQFAKMVVSGLDVPTRQPLTATFSDVPVGHMFFKYVEGASHSGLVQGLGGGIYGPDQPIARQQAASILGRYLSAVELEVLGHIAGSTGSSYDSLQLWYTAEGEDVVGSFSDDAEISDVHRAGVAYLLARDVTEGSAGRFNPLNPVSRAQSAVMILRVLAAAEAFQPAPTITAVNPKSGPASGGNTVVITGTNFTDDAVVQFGTSTVASAKVDVESPTKISVSAPAGTAGTTVRIAVTTAGGTTANTTADDYMYLSEVPTITSLDPAAGSALGGTEVIIYGTNFPDDEEDVDVYFGTKQVDPEDIDLEDDTEMTVIAPSGTDGTTVRVKVVTGKGTSQDTLADNYSYGLPQVTSLDPKYGDPDGGTQVTISGKCFSGEVDVRFGTTWVDEDDIDVLSPTQLEVVAPEGEDGDTVDVLVRNDYGVSANTAADDFTWDADFDPDAPTVTSLDPAAGKTTYGTEVIIYGTNFPDDEEDVDVYFGTKQVDPEDIDLEDDTEMTVIAPSGTDGTTVRVKVVTDKGTSQDTPADDYSYGVPRVTALSPTHGDPDGGTPVTITGKCFSGEIAVRFGTSLVDADDIEVLGPTQVRVIAPEGEEGETVNVVVGNDYGLSTNNAAYDDFTYDVESYTITASAGTGGTITPSGAVSVNAGANQTFSIAANAGYHIVDVVVDGTTHIGAATTYTFANVVANHTINATFAVNAYTITASAGTGGTITPSGAVNVSAGGNQTFTIAASAGYHVTNVLVDAVSLGAITSYTFTNVTSNHTISATFAINTYTLTPTAGLHGSIDPSTPVTANYGADVTFTFIPEADYCVADVEVDGVSKGPLPEWTFQDVKANHTIGVTFELRELSKIVAEYAVAGSGNWGLASTQTFLNGTYLDMRLRFLDQNDAPFAGENMSAEHPLYVWEHESDPSQKGSKVPNAWTTDEEGYVYWGNEGGFSDAMFTISLGLDNDASGDFVDPELHKSFEITWAEDA